MREYLDGNATPSQNDCRTLWATSLPQMLDSAQVSEREREREREEGGEREMEGARLGEAILGESRLGESRLG